MKFHVYQHPAEPDHYFITDDAAPNPAAAEKLGLSDMVDIGRFAEMGEGRAAFNEKIAQGAIRAQGYYEFTAMSDWRMETPGV